MASSGCCASAGWGKARRARRCASRFRSSPRSLFRGSASAAAARQRVSRPCPATASSWRGTARRRQSSHILRSAERDAGAEEHQLVVATQADDAVRLFQSNQSIDDALAVGPAIDVVAQEDEPVVGRRLDGVEQGVEVGRRAVDIAEGEGAHGQFARTSSRTSQSDGSLSNGKSVDTPRYWSPSSASRRW